MKLDKYIQLGGDAPVIGILAFNSEIFIRDYIRGIGVSYIELANLGAKTIGETELSPEDEQFFTNQSYQQVVLNCKHQLEDMATIVNRHKITSVFTYLPLNPRHRILIDTILQALIDMVQVPISVYYGFDYATYREWKNQGEGLIPQNLHDQVVSMLSAAANDSRTFFPAPPPSVREDLEKLIDSEIENELQRRKEPPVPSEPKVSLTKTPPTPVAPRNLSTYLYVSVTENLVDIVEDEFDVNPKYLYVVKGTKLSDGWLSDSSEYITVSGVAISMLIAFLLTTTLTGWRFILVLIAIPILIISSIFHLASRMFTTETVKTFEAKNKAETYAGILLYSNSEETFKGESSCKKSLLSRLALTILKLIQRLTK